MQLVLARFTLFHKKYVGVAVSAHIYLNVEMLMQNEFE